MRPWTRTRHTAQIPENDVFYTWTHINNLWFENFNIKVPGAKRKIIAIDCRNFGNGSMKTLRICTENITVERYTHIKPETPVPGFIGVYSVGSSNEGAIGRGYDFRGHVAKTLTMINCCDEGNVHLPQFSGEGHLTCIDFNIERFNADYIPDDITGNTTYYAKETVPGGWHGFISYTLQGNAFGLKQFWAEGSGINFKTADLNKSAASWF